QKLLEYAPTSLSRRVKTRLVHAAIAMSNAFDIHPHRLVLKNHLQLCGQDPVASGSFGDVWKGSCILNGEHVSVKVFRTYQNGVSSGSKDFTKEAMIWRQLNHPNVLPFYGVYYLDDARNRLCLVSPWMEEGNVVNYLQRCPSTNRVALAYDIANGLAYLHGEKVVHGDLKGVNILVSESGKACIGDFGLASITDVATMYSRANPSSASSCHGTIRWLAPEVMETGHATERSDIYAFACVLYELFAGHPPFVEIALDATVMWKVAFQQQRPARPPSAVLSDAVWQLITRCWAHDFATRPSAEDALFALRAELAVTPDAATWDPSIPSRIRAAIEELP
ncbi:kinase-like domain-containing protein, partial [Schizophyllum fasciatum]